MAEPDQGVRRFADRVVLVTGAGRGMGKVVAESFAREGAVVVVAARTAEPAERTLDELRSRGHRASVVLGDLAVHADVTAMVEHAVSEHGRLDVVVHCAADNAQGRLAEMSDDALDHLLRSNVHALHWLAKAAVPHLRESSLPGRMVFISSGSANRVFTPGLNAYASTKAYLESFARGLANEVGPEVLVNVVAPGMTATDRMLAHLTPEQVADISAGYAVPRAGTSEEIASAVLFLASPDAAYVTGASLLVDGGATMAPFPAKVLRAQ